MYKMHDIIMLLSCMLVMMMASTNMAAEIDAREMTRARKRAVQMLRHSAERRSPVVNHEHDAKQYERKYLAEKEKAQIVVNEEEEKLVERENAPAVQQEKENKKFIEKCRIEEQEAEIQAEEMKKAEMRRVQEAQYSLQSANILILIPVL